jgi:hypothetical protein
MERGQYRPSRRNNPGFVDLGSGAGAARHRQPQGGLSVTPALGPFLLRKEKPAGRARQKAATGFETVTAFDCTSYPSPEGRTARLTASGYWRVTGWLLERY